MKDANMNIAPVQEDTADILAKTIVLTSWIPVKSEDC